MPVSVAERNEKKRRTLGQLYPDTHMNSAVIPEISAPEIPKDLLIPEIRCSVPILEAFTDSIIRVPETHNDTIIEIPETSINISKKDPETNDEQPKQPESSCCRWIKAYFKKFRGLKADRPKRLPWREYIWSFLGVFLSIAAVAFLHYRFLERLQLSFFIASHGASAALLFGLPNAGCSQPRSLVFGHLIGALCGCVARITIGSLEYSVASCLAVASCTFLMQFTETLHPPACATALIAVTAKTLLPWAHFSFILMPTLTGALIILLVALIINNMSPQRVYPTFWW